MKKLLAIAALAVASCLSAFATTTTVSGTKTFYPISFPLSTGQFCFGGTCLTITNGAFSGGLTSATGTVTITSPSGTQIYLSIPSVVISGTTYNWDTFVVPATASIFGMGSPTIPCSAGAAYAQTDAMPTNQNWQCRLVGGSPTWVPVGPTAAMTQGISIGNGNYATSHNISVPSDCIANSGSATAYVCATVPSFTPTTGDNILLLIDVASGASPTLSVNGASAAPLKKWGGSGSLVAGDLLAGQWTSATFDGTNWQIDGQLGNGNQFVSRGRTTALTATTILTTTATALYSIRAAVACDSASASATATMTITYTDPSSTVQTIAPGAATCTTLGSASVAQTNTVVNALTGTAIQIAVAIANTPTYDVAASVVASTKN
jgi:hypothetical protein